MIDPRSLVPLDRDTILRSVAKTGRLVVVDPAHKTCSAASEIAALVAEEAFGDLKAPIVRVTAPDVQVPFSPALESLMYPTKEKIDAAVRRTVGIGGPGADRGERRLMEQPWFISSEDAGLPDP